MRNTGDSSQKSLRHEIRITGSGDQDIILSGMILAEAAILDGMYVAQSQSHGPDARVGVSTTEIILSDVAIDYPRTLGLDLLVALTQESYDRNIPDLKMNGTVIVDSDRVRRVLWGKVARIPFSKIAQGAGDKSTINIAALGAIASFCSRIRRDSLSKIIENKLPADKVTLNLLAFDEALKVAHNIGGNLKSVDTEEEFEI